MIVRPEDFESCLLKTPVHPPDAGKKRNQGKEFLLGERQGRRTPLRQENRILHGFCLP
jgi:hypothetical protein